MKILRRIKEDEMVACFLQAEMGSKRFQKSIDKILLDGNYDMELISNPDFSNEKENKIRFAILNSYRGFGDRKALFQNFPKKIDWYEIELDKDAIVNIKYINYDYWKELSSDTRLPSFTADNIRSGKVVFKQSNDNFLEAAAALRTGTAFPKMILVTKNKQSYLVVLEGNLRLTAYALEPGYIPQKLTAILGISNEIDKWSLY